MRILKKVRAHTFVLQRYGTFIAFFSKTLWSSSGHQKFEFWVSAWNFVQIKVSMRIVYGESFNHFGCSYLEIWRITCIHLLIFRYSYLKIGATKMIETFTINSYHRDLYLYKVSSRNPELKFVGFCSKMQSKSHISAAQMYAHERFLRIRITRWSRHSAHSLDSKAMGHLERFPRKLIKSPSN